MRFDVLRPEVANKPRGGSGPARPGRGTFVVKDRVDADPGLFGVYPGEGTKHDGILHSLALMNGDELDRLVVAFEAELMVLGGLLLAGPLRPEPAHETGGTEAMFQRRLMQYLAQVQHVGEPAL